MAKKTSASSSAKSQPATATSSTSIDDIFAAPAKKLKVDSDPIASSSRTAIDDKLSKGKKKQSKSYDDRSTTSAKEPIGSGSTLDVVEDGHDGELKTKKKKKVKTIASFDPSQPSVAAAPRGTSSFSCRRVVEVIDPSSVPPTTAILPTAVTASSKGKGKVVDMGKAKGVKRDRKDDEEDEMFRDSRGEGPRRKTEEGFLIYKEAELKIDPEAGGTPLCPFDCDCCF
ncbi:hypothetical protein IAR55_003613 [Kwoniella newhampshirensis]|uniref:DUF1764-domain-containing protein n=1 Tax=Kwoniella newhampshirensis TaxID=1651941 RepID=A0AAW0YS35_9TREE